MWKFSTEWSVPVLLMERKDIVSSLNMGLAHQLDPWTISVMLLRALKPDFCFSKIHFAP